MADQWKEFFYCEAMDKEVSDNIITSGSGIAVADGQCMMIVEQGKVVDICADPGEYTYDASTEPSIFAGGLGEGIRRTFQTIGKRFVFGGDTGKDQRVYYFNTKELVDNKFGTATLFYTNVCGNVEREYTREELDGQLKTEFVSALQPAFGRLSEMELRPNQIVTHNTELENAMNEVLSAKWAELRGLKVVSVALGSVTLPDEDAEMIKQAQRTAMMRDPSMAAATLTGAQADAMKAAASNSAGAMTGFMGMGMAASAGGLNAQQLFEMGQKREAQAAQNNVQTQPKIRPAAGGDSWTCSCGAVSTGKFCPECGAPRPVEDSWTCSCGTVNKGKFCTNCGAKRPEKKLRYRCSRCGWEPADPENPPKFCPECGDPFGPEDAV